MNIKIIEPCPFCGCATPWMWKDTDNGVFHVHCLDCGARGPETTSLETALSLWNKTQEVRPDNSEKPAPEKPVPVQRPRHVVSQSLPGIERQQEKTLWIPVKEFPGLEFSPETTAARDMASKKPFSLRFKQATEKRGCIYVKIARLNIPGITEVSLAKVKLAYCGEKPPVDWPRRAVVYKNGDWKDLSLSNLAWGGVRGVRTQVFVFMANKCVFVCKTKEDAARKTKISSYSISKIIDTGKSINGYTFKSSVS